MFASKAKKPIGGTRIKKKWGREKEWNGTEEKKTPEVFGRRCNEEKDGMRGCDLRGCRVRRYKIRVEAGRKGGRDETKGRESSKVKPGTHSTTRN